MNTKLYINTDILTAGITLRDPSEPEDNNMALHACDNTDNILENRRKLAVQAGCGLNDFVCAYQSHSANFHKVVLADKGRGSVTMGDAVPNTDALYTFEPNLLLCCFTADCVPVILYDNASGLIGAIHSGWGGTVREIVPKVLEHLIQVEKCSPKDMQILIGPAIGQDKFEVDRDVYDRFKALGYADEFLSFNRKTGKYHIDNQLTVKRQCELQGIPAAHISVDRTCTHTSSDCFSFRRDKACGRHLSFIIRKK